MWGLLAETQKKVSWDGNHISWGEKSLFAVAIIWYDVGMNEHVPDRSVLMAGGL